MSVLTEWIARRMELLGLVNRKELCCLAQVDAEPIDELFDLGNLDPLPNRSDRRRLAMALRVSVKWMENLDAGNRRWIEDYEYCDYDSGNRPPPSEDPDLWWQRPEPATEEERGTPLIGRVRSDGSIDLDDAWTMDCGEKVPARFGNGRDVYALKLADEKAAVFRNAPAWELRTGETAAVFLSNGFDGRAFFARAQEGRGGALRLAFEDGSSLEIDPEKEELSRVGKVIGRWPKEEAA